MNLYPFQDKIINIDVKEAFRKGFTAPVVVSPTGSGKTVMFATIAIAAMNKMKDVLILVHKREILKQTLKKLFSLGAQAGQVASGKSITRDKIQVAMVGTLVRRLDKIRRPGLIIIDECHHSVANQWLKILNHFKDLPRIGFTATPERDDGTGLDLVFDTMIQAPQISELVKQGYLSYPVMYTPEKEIIMKCHIKRGDFDKNEQAQQMSKKIIVGNVIEQYREHLDTLPAVCFCVSLKHCDLMDLSFKNAGYKSMMVYGGMPENDRERAFKGLEDGSIHIIHSCDLISEGVDVPVMAGCILLRRTLSLALYLQMCGRPLRISPGKNHSVILDPAGNYYLHGHVLADREWSLNSIKRKLRKEKSPTTTRCPKCFAVWPGEPQVCPGTLKSGSTCGFVFSENESVSGQQRKNPEMIAGELIAALPPGSDPLLIDKLKQNALMIQKMDPKVRQKYMIKMAYELRDKKEIAALAKVIGYKQGWSSWVWKNVLGNR